MTLISYISIPKMNDKGYIEYIQMTLDEYIIHLHIENKMKNDIRI